MSLRHRGHFVPSGTPPGGTILKTLTYTAVGTPALDRGLTLSSTHSYTGIGSSSMSKSLQLSLLISSIVATGSSAITKTVGKGLSYIANGAPDVLKKMFNTSTYSATGSVLFDEGLVTSHLASMSATATPFSLAEFIEGTGVDIPLESRGTYQDIAKFLAQTGAFTSTQNNDIIVEWLKSEGVSGSQFNDLFVKYWEGLGHTGAYNDKWKKWRGND